MNVEWLFVAFAAGAVVAWCVCRWVYRGRL